MESKVKLFGHSVHQMLIVFPLGLLITAVIFDAIFMITGNATFALIAYWNIIGGIIGGLLAAIPGWIDWRAISPNTRAKRVGMWHGVGNVIVIALFAISWFLRQAEPSYLPTMLAFVLEIGAVGLGGLTAWLGGELVDRLGVGVDPGAHLNAPNSLSGRPASEQASPR